MRNSTQPECPSAHRWIRRRASSFYSKLNSTDSGSAFVYGPRQLILYEACQVFLALQLDVGVVVGHIDAAVAGNLAGLDGACAALLPQSDVGPPQRVQPESRKIVTRCLGCKFQRLANA